VESGESRRNGVRALVACTLLAASTLSAQSEGAKRWWAHVEFLADDKLEGRAPGTAGYTKAAQYVAQQFDSLALRPMAGGTFFQRVPFSRSQLREDQSSVELVRGDVTERLILGQHANLNVRGESGRTVEGGLVFVGHGLRIPELGIDDLAGLDLKGRIAVVLRGAPSHVPGAMAAHAQSTAEHWRNLRSAGAIGVVTITNPKRVEIPWERSAAMRLRPHLSLVEAGLVDTTGQQVSVTLNPAHAGRLFDGSGHTAEELFTLMDADKELPRFPLKASLRAKTVFDTTTMQAENILGGLPGTDPKLRSECIVFSAHLDHLGKRGDSVYNGAMDNASGVATLIEVARALQGKKLKRSVVFAAVTGEESGLLGSKYLAAHPVGAVRVVANLNTDMFLPIIPLKAITVLGLEESDLGEAFAAAAGRFNVDVKADPEPQRNGFIRSDQYSFIRRGIPSLALRFHAQPGTPEAETMRRWLAERYHGPADDLQQPVDRESAARFNDVVASFVEEVANRRSAPKWASGSFFRRYSLAR
jgi:hypothetical protein